MKKLISGLVMGLALVSLVACGGDDKPTDTGTNGGNNAGETDPAPAPTEKKDYDAADHTGGVKGTVTFAGDRPAAKVLPIGGDPVCMAAYAEGPPSDPRTELGPNGEVPHAFVKLSGAGAKAYTFGVEDAPTVLVDQQECMYVPHVFGVMEGQDFVVRNSDATLHNVNAKPKRNDGFNKAQPKQGDEDTFSFAKKENAVAFGCDVHKWMSAWCFVSEHPLFATTDANGNFEISNVPDGEYEMVVWHEAFADMKNLSKTKIKVEGGKIVEQAVALD